MKVTNSDLQNISNVLWATCVAAGTIAEHKNSVRAAKACVISGLSAAAISIVGNIMYLKGKIDY